MMFNVHAPTINFSRSILSEPLVTSDTLPTHFSTSNTPTPPSPLSFPIQKSLWLEFFPTIILADSPLHLTSCKKKMSIPRQVRVSTTSLDRRPLSVPTVRVPILNLCEFGVSLDSAFRYDLLGPNLLLPTLPLLTPSTGSPVPTSL